MSPVISSIMFGLEGNEYMSCPFLFTFDGSNYNMENDIISVARTEAREYTDYLFINNPLVDVNNKIKFKLESPIGETSQLDLLELHVINHPNGTKAGVDELGNAHTYMNPSPPNVATSDGNDVLDKLSTDDEQGILLYHDESVIVQFPTTDLSLGGKLVLKIDGFERSTTLPKTPTGQVPAIEIQTLENGTWVTRSRFYPKEYKAYGVFDLKQYLDPTNPKIRLLSKACALHVATFIDYVALDNTADNYTTSKLPLTKALVDNTDDVLNLVVAADDNYLEFNGSSVLEMEFDSIVPPGANDYFFVSKGYYDRLGNTFYVYTKDDSGNWQQRWVSAWYDFQGPNDITVEIDLSSYQSAYFPNPDGTFDVKVANYETYFPGSLEWAEVDYVYLKINGTLYKIKSAVEEGTGDDILDKVKASDEVDWDAANRSAIITFEPVTRGICLKYFC
jgi:hypothetical protein